jgi:hypothetical protein
MRKVLFVCTHNAPVRSFVMTIADRKPRDCLASGGCTVPAG